MIVVLLLSAAGGLGAVLRFVFDGVISSRARWSSLGTAVVNVSGSLALGLLTGLALTALVPASWQLVLGTGFLGGYTTFSTASMQSVRLLQERRLFAFFANAFGVLLLSAGAAALGLWVALPG